MDTAIQEINKKVHKESLFVQELKAELSRVIVGQEEMLERILVGLLADGHLLLEGVPGLAKTLTVKTLAKAVSATFSRIQFTPDLLPADIVGTLIFSPKDSSFSVRKGPIFAQLILADEIARLVWLETGRHEPDFIAEFFARTASLGLSDWSGA